ncbi:IS481 family transposase [Carboxydothermus ferrireducens]|uniref:IS481 family transposase n=1 Tax=Carboxydothermus ferrireducens TaxID=54265 RepID=UPI0015CBA253|nr:IS481 family transposase [Carboxydothermus ferrireducens]
MVRLPKESSYQQEIALERFALIAPLLEPDLEAAEKRQRRKEILAKSQISSRTLRRYLQLYRQQGLSGLMPKIRSDNGSSRTISHETIEEAVKLKEELPERSVSQIIAILEGEKKVSTGMLARSTLGRHLSRLGLTQKEANQKISGHRRFAKEQRNRLWQADIKYGPYLLHPQNPKRKVRTYLVAFIDDATRLLCHGEFYLDQKRPVLEDCFRKAILKRGIPDAVYVDNGKIFVSRWFRLGCAKLGIRPINTKPYSPESKGKIERFNRTVESFIAEIELQQPKTLAELNQAFAVWVEEGYNHHPHSSLENETPANRFQKDTRRLRFASLEECREAFLWEASRRVDKTGCIKLEGRFYEIGLEWIRKTVDLRYDPFDLESIEFWYNGQKQGLAKPLVIQEYNNIAFKNKKEQENKTPKTSRLLTVLEERSIERRRRKLGAIPFRQLEGGK